MGLERPPAVDPGRELDEEISEVDEIMELVEDEKFMDVIDPWRE